MTQGELEQIPEGIRKAFSDLEIRIMSDIVRRIKINGFATASADWQLTRLQQLGMSEQDIRKWIRITLDISEEELEQIFSDEVYKEYMKHERAYKINGMEQIPYDENEELQELVESIRQQTHETFRNITGTMGFVKQDAAGRVQPVTLTEYYRTALDSAMLDIHSGAFDYQTVLMRTITDMTRSGVRWIDYASGRHNRIDVAARRAIMTGFRQVQGRINEQVAADLGTDSYEVTYHVGARPTHQPWQGKVWTMKQLREVCGLGTAGGLHGANCYHDYNAFLPGISVRTYTDEQLERMTKRENTPKTYNGKQYTTYEALQQQRAMERNMRKTRQDIKLMEEGEADQQSIMLKKGKYYGQMQTYVDFSEKMGLPQQRDRIYQDGLKGNFSSKAAYDKIQQNTAEKEAAKQAVKSVANSGKSGILNIEAESGSAKYREIKRQKIIEQGITQKRPIFADDDFGKYVSRIPAKEGFYDVALHGAVKYTTFYGERINADTLSDIIRARSDYDGTSKIRLLSCNTGKGEKCFAQSLANKLGVSVEAPNDIIWARPDGTFTIGPTKYKNTGKMITFKPERK